MFQQGVSRFVIALGTAAMAAGVAACGGPSSNSPTAPTSSAAGATISGTVLGLTAASQLRAQRVSAGVTTTGATSAATVDDSGHFTLTNVMAGPVDLHFTGTGVDSHLVLDNVPANSTIVITVRVNPNDAHLEDEQVEGDANDEHQQGDVELSGSIAAGSLGGTCPSSLSFKIGTTLVTTNAQTRFEDTSCGALAAGDSVEVRGTRQADASVLASRVERNH